MPSTTTTAELNTHKLQYANYSMPSTTTTAELNTHTCFWAARITTCAHIARCFLERASSRRPRDTIPRDVGGAGGGADLCDSFPGKGERQAEDLRLTRDLRVGAGRKHGNLDSAGERMPDCAGERIRDLKWMLKNLGEALWYYKMVVFRALEDCALGTEPNVPAALVGTCYNNMACIRLRTACIIHSACHDDSNARGGKAGRGGRAGKGAGAEDETRKEFLLCLVKWRRGWSWKGRWGKQMDEYGVNEPSPSSALHPAFGMPLSVGLFCSLMGLFLGLF